MAALADRGACLMRHHGLLAVGADLDRALRAASVSEHAARVYLDARAQGVAVPELAPADVAAIARCVARRSGARRGSGGGRPGREQSRTRSSASGASEK